MEQSPTFFDPTLFLLFGFMILIYFLMIRPENKRRKTHQEMLASLDTGEEIVTAGGILGKVTKISEQYIELSISDNTKIKIQKRGRCSESRRRIPRAASAFSFLNGKGRALPAHSLSPEGSAEFESGLGADGVGDGLSDRGVIVYRDNADRGL